MHNEFYILVADRNRHVREFLRRELIAQGYRVQVAGDGREVVHMVEGPERPDLLVLDLDLPYVDGFSILERLQDRNPLMPVVVHALLGDYADSFRVRHAAAFVEKSGDTNSLKAAVGDALQRFYPHRFALGHARKMAALGESGGGKQ